MALGVDRLCGGYLVAVGGLTDHGRATSRSRYRSPGWCCSCWGRRRREDGGDRARERQGPVPPQGDGGLDRDLLHPRRSSWSCPSWTWASCGSNFWYIAKGLEFTILLAVFAIVLATILALFGALGRLSQNPVAYGVSGFYTSFFRGTPLIVQLFLIYLALPRSG